MTSKNIQEKPNQLFKTFKGKDGSVPPDIGKEEAEEGKKKKEGTGDDEPAIATKKRVKKAEEISYKPASTKVLSEDQKLTFEKINARLESMNSLIKNYMERFSALSEQIGEIRTMTLANEKEIFKSAKKSAVAIDIVDEVKPEKLRMDYQRLDSKLAVIAEKMESSKQFMETMMNEIKDMKRETKSYIGTKALLKLNEEVKKDMIKIQKLSYRTKLHSDKAEQLFIELKKEFAKNEKIRESVENIYALFSEYKRDMGKTKLHYDNIISITDSIKEDNKQMNTLVENVLLTAKTDREDYDKKMLSVLELIDNLNDEFSEIRGKPELTVRPMLEKPKKVRKKAKKAKPGRKEKRKARVKTKITGKTKTIRKEIKRKAKKSKKEKARKQAREKARRIEKKRRERERKAKNLSNARKNAQKSRKMPKEEKLKEKKPEEPEKKKEKKPKELPEPGIMPETKPAEAPKPGENQAGKKKAVPEF